MVLDLRPFDIVEGVVFNDLFILVTNSFPNANSFGNPDSFENPDKFENSRPDRTPLVITSKISSCTVFEDLEAILYRSNESAWRKTKARFPFPSYSFSYIRARGSRSEREALVTPRSSIIFSHLLIEWPHCDFPPETTLIVPAVFISRRITRTVFLVAGECQLNRERIVFGRMLSYRWGFACLPSMAKNDKTLRENTEACANFDDAGAGARLRLSRTMPRILVIVVGFCGWYFYERLSIPCSVI